MKKQLIIIGIIVLLITVGLCGCDESSQKSGITITNIVATTHWIDGGRQESHEGFYHEAFSDIPFNVNYQIQATVVNNAGKQISLRIITNLYDANNNLLWTDKDSLTPIFINDLPNTYNKTFTKTIYETSLDYFYYVERCNFEFEVLEI